LGNTKFGRGRIDQTQKETRFLKGVTATKGPPGRKTHRTEFSGGGAKGGTAGGGLPSSRPKKFESQKGKREGNADREGYPREGSHAAQIRKKNRQICRRKPEKRVVTDYSKQI